MSLLIRRCHPGGAINAGWRGSVSGGVRLLVGGCAVRGLTAGCRARDTGVEIAARRSERAGHRRPRHSHKRFPAADASSACSRRAGSRSTATRSRRCRPFESGRPGTDQHRARRSNRGRDHRPAAAYPGAHAHARCPIRAAVRQRGAEYAAARYRRPAAHCLGNCGHPVRFGNSCCTVDAPPITDGVAIPSGVNPIVLSQNRVFFALLSAIGIGALVAVVPLVSAQTIPVQPQATTGISVVGQGIVLADPNVARITLGSEVFDQSLARAEAEAARRMDAVVTRLKASGIADADIRTTAFNISPQYDQGNQNSQAVLRGYQVQNLVEVRSTNVAGLGALLDDAVSSGATRVFGIAFESDNMDALKNQARDQAMTNARAKADQLARDAGVSVGRPTTIEESDTGGVTPVRAFDAAPAAAQAVTTPVQPGQLRVSTNVHVVWSIQ